MDAIIQTSTKIFENATIAETVSLAYIDTTDQEINLYLITPFQNDNLIIIDLGNASTNNIVILSDKLINGSSSYSIDKDNSVLELIYNKSNDEYIAKELEGYQVVNSNTAIGAGVSNVYVDSSSGSFTLTLNSEPKINNELYIVDYVGSCGSFPVTIDGNSRLIIGYSNVLMNLDYIAYNLKFTGTQYNI